MAISQKSESRTYLLAIGPQSCRTPAFEPSSSGSDDGLGSSGDAHDSEGESEGEYDSQGEYRSSATGSEARSGSLKLDATTIYEVQPSGPSWLRWVESAPFTAVASAVICVNLVTMGIEALHPERVQEFQRADEASMLFYIFELLLKAGLWQERWLVGNCTRVLWNWLDLVIVLTGCVDMFVMPLLEDVGIASKHGAGLEFAPFLRALRLLRLARVLRIVKVLWLSDTTWMESENFQLFMMGVIASSCLVMGFEADFPDFFLWFYLEQLVLAIFTFELLVRLKNYGWAYFCKEGEVVWNWLDFIIVCGGVVDQWMLPSFELVMALAGDSKGSSGGDLGRYMMMLRMARLLRILRLVRLIKNIPPLFALLKGIAQAMAGMMWVLLLTSVLLYACTLLCVKLLRDGIVYGGEAPVEVVEVFPSVPDTFFNLFSIMNGNTSLLEPVFSTFPLFKVAYAIFIIISSWAILSILTAVVSENMITSTNQLLDEKKAEELVQKKETRRTRLNEILDSAPFGTEGGTSISVQQFEYLMSDKALKEEICVATQMTERDLLAVFTATSRGKGNSGLASREKFLDSLEVESEIVTVRTVLRLEKHLEGLQDDIEELKAIVAKKNMSLPVVMHHNPGDGGATL